MTNSKKLIIACDGESASGKSTAAKLISKKYKLLLIYHTTVLLSPSSASYDQYKNFNQRGNHFKKLVKFYAKKYL